MSFFPERCPACNGDGSLIHAGWFGASGLFRCLTCSTEWVAPQPSDARLAEIYGSGYYAAWSYESPDGLDAMKRRTFGPLLDACGLSPGASVLDVGCATGSFLGFAADHGVRTFGVDLNPVAIETAASRVPSATVHAGTLADAPFDGVTFDAIVMNDFIEHVRDPRREIGLAAKRLDRGGRIAISTPRADSLMRRVMQKSWPQYREEHLTYFSSTGLSSLLDESGFEVRSRTVTRKAVTLGYAYGQAQAYPVKMVTPLTTAAYRALPFARRFVVQVPMGEMTIVATRA